MKELLSKLLDANEITLTAYYVLLTAYTQEKERVSSEESGRK